MKINKNQSLIFALELLINSVVRHKTVQLLGLDINLPHVAPANRVAELTI